MSHVIACEAQIRSLEALETACERLGLELVRDQTTFRWYEHVGDYELPVGFTKEEMGQCQHAIRIPGDSRAYEVGVVERRDGQDGWCLMFDFWNRGYGMQEKVGGEMCQGLVHEYVCAVAEEHLGDLWVQDRTQLEDGSTVIEFTL